MTYTSQIHCATRIIKLNHIIGGPCVMVCCKSELSRPIFYLTHITLYLYQMELAPFFKFPGQLVPWKVLFLKIGQGRGGEPGIFWFLLIFSLSGSALDHSATVPSKFCFNPTTIQSLKLARVIGLIQTNPSYKKTDQPEITVFIVDRNLQHCYNRWQTFLIYRALKK